MDRMAWARAGVLAAGLAGAALLAGLQPNGSAEARGAGPAYSSAAGLPAGAVILPGSKANALLSQCSRGAPSANGTWRPSPADIRSLEAQLPSALRRLRATDGALGRAPAGYGRQYVGIVVSGRRLVYGNYFRLGDPLLGDWRTGPVMVCDGGTNFFGVTYDVAAGRIIDIQFNGLA
jgi:hypothetical protein